MNIRYLTYFVEVAKEKNFTRAANNLHLSQPALSKVMKNLEIDLGISLIDRTAKHFKLTDQGEIFYENARKALENINLELEELSCSINSTKGRIIVGIPPVIGTVYFPTIIAKFRNEYPDIEFIMVEEGANTIKDKVNDSEIDIGVVMLPVASDELSAIEIINSENVLIVHKNNHLAKNKNVSIRDLKEETFMTLNENYMLYDKLKRMCKKAGFEPNIQFESSQWDFIAEMVSLNQGIALLPGPIVERFKNDNIKSISLRDQEMPWNIGIVTKKDRYLSYGMKEFIKFVKAETEEMRNNP